MYNVFILGPSNSGKTSIANLVSQALVMPVISASDWVRKEFIGSTLPKQQLIEAMTSYSQKQLHQDPEVCLKHIRTNYPDVETKRGFILEGFRNPKDFLTLFNPRTDLVVRLSYTGNPYHGMSFERKGILVIDQSIDWFLQNELMQRQQYIQFSFDNLSDIPDIAAVVTNAAGVWIQEVPL